DVLEKLIAAHVQAPSSASNECSGRSSVPRATSPVHASGGISFGFLRHCLDDIVLALETPVRQRFPSLKRLRSRRAFGRVIDELGLRSGKFQSLQSFLCTELVTCGHRGSSSFCDSCPGGRVELCVGLCVIAADTSALFGEELGVVGFGTVHSRHHPVPVRVVGGELRSHCDPVPGLRGKGE